VAQQQEISFDQSGSIAQYLRADGPNIVLNVADVLAGNYGTSSSSDEASSSFVGPLQLPLQLQIVEGQDFQDLNIMSIPGQLHLPIVLDRFSVNVGHKESIASKN
jgi:hypothetical protein